MPRSKQDPLIAALVKKLPPAGTEWAPDDQIAWLNLMAMAFGPAYGGKVAMNFGAAGSVVEAFTHRNQGPPKPKPPAHRFIIDEHGYAKNAQGKRVLPKDCGMVPIFDMRGQDGDMRTIIWADDSRGLNGADLVITA